MFRVSFFVDDKKLPAALKGVAGLAHDLEAVPVTEKPASNGGPKISDIDLTGLKTITANILKEKMVAAGLSPASLSYTVKGLMKAGRLKKHGKGIYRVVS